MNEGPRSDLRERLTRAMSIPWLDRLHAYVETLSPGDRMVFFVLAGVVALASVTSLYALERSLLSQVPSYGGTLVEGSVGSPQFINPLLAVSDADRDLETLTYSGLMGLSGDGTLVPIVAESYEVSADGKTYTFVLRKNARFTDGTPVTADDVVFTVKKAQDPALKSPEYANWAGITVVALDPETVQFTLSKPYAPFLGLTALGILPAHLWQNISDAEFPFSTLETKPIGTGPFQVSDISRNASGLIQTVSLSENPYYPLGRPYLDGIHFKYYANAADLGVALSSGAVESAYGIQKSGALTAPYARVFGVFFNPNENQVYARIEVRKALSIALDRDAIVKEVLGGFATPITGPLPPTTDTGAAASGVATDATASAADVLEKAGWTYDGDARTWKNSAQKQILTSITIRTSNVPELKAVASAVKADWEKLGVPVDIELYEPGDLSQNVIRPRKYEALLYGLVIGRDQDLYAFWDSQERNDPGLNIAMYANKNVDALLEDARSATDPKARATDLEKISADIAADYPAAFIYAPSFVYSIPNNLQGVALPQIITPSDRFASVATWYQYTDAVWPFLTRTKHQ